MPMGIKPMKLAGTEKTIVPGYPPLDTRFVEITGEIHECIINVDKSLWDWEDVANGDAEKDLFKTEQNKNDLQHRFDAPRELVEDGKFAEVQYFEIGVVQAPLSEMDHFSLIDGGYIVIKHKDTEVFRDRLKYLTGGRQYVVQPDAPVLPAARVTYGTGAYTDLRSVFKTRVFKGGATFYAKAYWPGNVALTATKTLELRLYILELSPLVFIKHDESVRGAG